MNRSKIHLDRAQMKTSFFILGWEFHFDLGHKDLVSESLNILYSVVNVKVEFKNVSVVRVFSKGWWDNGWDLLRGENRMGVCSTIQFECMSLSPKCLNFTQTLIIGFGFNRNILPIVYLSIPNLSKYNKFIYLPSQELLWIGKCYYINFTVENQ